MQGKKWNGNSFVKFSDPLELYKHIHQTNIPSFLYGNIEIMIVNLLIMKILPSSLSICRHRKVKCHIS